MTTRGLGHRPLWASVGLALSVTLYMAARSGEIGLTWDECFYMTWCLCFRRNQSVH